MHLSSPPAIPPLVEFRSNLGQQLWNECTIKSQQMMDQYFEYDQPQLSGPASLVMLINAINVAYRIKLSNAKTEEEAEILMKKVDQGLQITLSLDEMLEIQTQYLNNTSKETGFSMPQLELLAMHLGFGTFLKIAQNEPNLSESQLEEIDNFIAKDSGSREIFTNADKFKEFISEKLLVRVSGIIVNYDQSILGISEEPKNVFSVIAGSQGDHVLVMDNGQKGPMWVHVTKLFEAMAKIDIQSGIPMGTHINTDKRKDWF
ncbi:uncharacterized protein [Clytia hemisphaerica]|uniref:uncharacterized protein isoform X1 n=1 Tax=Clytia hemisphaerica TaxID=252671 RepID=UPI0034D51C59